MVIGFGEVFIGAPCCKRLLSSGSIRQAGERLNGSFILSAALPGFGLFEVPVKVTDL